MIAVAVLALCVPVQAGSVFSANGVGEQLPGGGTRTQGLGGGGIGLADSLAFNTMNPALSAFVPRTTFRVGGQIGFWNTTAHGRTDADGEFTWQDVAIYVPMTARWKLGFGAQPLRQMDIMTFEPDTAVFAGTADTVAFEKRNRWRGSAIELRLDNSVRVTDKLALGVSAAYTLLRVERRQTIDLPQRVGRQYYYDTAYRQVETFRGWSAAVGGYYQVSPRVGVGLMLKPRVTGNWTYDFSKLDADSSLKRDRRGKSPGDFRVGASYRFAERMRSVADIAVGQWEREDLGILLADSLHSAAPINPLFVSLGIEREAGRAPLFTGFQLLVVARGGVLPPSLLAGATGRSGRRYRRGGGNIVARSRR